MEEKLPVHSRVRVAFTATLDMATEGKNVSFVSVKTYETLSREYFEFMPCSLNSKS
jgi:hypothetical protein